MKRNAVEKGCIRRIILRKNDPVVGKLSKSWGKIRGIITFFVVRCLS